MIDSEGFWTPPEDATPEPEATSPAWLPVALLVGVVLGAGVGLWWWA